MNGPSHKGGIFPAGGSTVRHTRFRKSPQGYPKSRAPLGSPKVAPPGAMGLIGVPGRSRKIPTGREVPMATTGCNGRYIRCRMDYPGYASMSTGFPNKSDCYLWVGVGYMATLAVSSHNTQNATSWAWRSAGSLASVNILAGQNTAQSPAMEARGGGLESGWGGNKG